VRSISVYYICAVTITTAVRPFFQIQLLSISAGPSVLTTGVYPPGGLIKTNFKTARKKVCVIDVCNHATNVCMAGRASMQT
jgi:hypothetical protein